MRKDIDNVPIRSKVDEILQFLTRDAIFPVKRRCGIPLAGERAGGIVGAGDHIAQADTRAAHAKRVGIIVSMAGRALVNLDTAAQRGDELGGRMPDHSPDDQFRPRVAAGVSNGLVTVIDFVCFGSVGPVNIPIHPIGGLDNTGLADDQQIAGAYFAEVRMELGAPAAGRSHQQV